MGGAHDEGRQTPELGAVVWRANVAWVAVGTEVIVRAPLATFVLDPVSSVMWQCLDTSSPLGEVLADIADGFGVPMETAVADCLPVVRSWIAEGIAVDRSAASESHDPTDAGHAHESGRRWRHLVDPPNS